MIIKALKLEKLEIPFKVSFKHASASRSQTESIIVLSESETGHKGFGEGCPRSYVTGETIKTAVGFFEKHRPSLQKIANLDDIKLWVANNQPEIDQNPAAWCAIEISLLDLLGKEHQQSLEALLSLPELSQEFSYSAVMGISNLKAFEKQYKQYMGIGFLDYKIKISGNLPEDTERVGLFKALGNERVRVRLDANNLWENADEAIDYIGNLKYPFFAIEEPLKAGDFEGCRKLFDALKARIILDESFIRAEHFQNIQHAPETWIVNLRVSKMGGLLRSLSIAEQAQKLGIPIVIGAQVGETSILSRTALTVANTYRDILIAQEGAFGTHLLEHDITDQPIMFGQNGILDALPYAKRHGLGIPVEPATKI